MFLQKHEPEVLNVVKKRGAAEQRKRRDGGTREQRKQVEVSDAMEASLSEGWSLLLHLLQRRLEVLTLTSDFYLRAAEVRSF